MVKKLLCFAFAAAFSFVAASAVPAAEKTDAEYRVGADDIIDILVLKPENISSTVTVAPDGSMNFLYVGNLRVDGMTLSEIQKEVERRLADGYLKYPVVSVSLKESRSRKFSVYGEVARPGTYALAEDTTVLKAISTAGGFTKYASSSRVKVLRPQGGGSGYENIKVNINAIMKGSSQEDILLKAGDIVVVTEGMF